MAYSFPREFIDKVKATVDLVKLAGEYTELHKAGSNLYMGRCPHPEHEDKDPSFRVWTDGKYHSWSCMVCHCGSKDTKNKQGKNFGTDCIAFYQWVENVSWGQAVMDICKKYEIPIPKSEYDKYYTREYRKMLSYKTNLDTKAKRYLYDRGLADNDIESWNIGYSNNKIVFPLMDRYKKPIGFTRRWLQVPEGSNDKYRNSATSKIFDKKHYLYGIHNLDDCFDEIRITEGPMDVILANKYGLKNIVCSLGTAFTDEHVEIIKELDKVPVFVMDGDGPGIDAAERAINKLAAANVYSKILILPESKDLCDMSLLIKDGIEDYVNMYAVTYGQYKMNKVFSAYESSITELKLKYFGEIKKVINTVPHEAERSIIEQEILSRMNIKI